MKERVGGSVMGHCADCRKGKFPGEVCCKQRERCGQRGLNVNAMAGQLGQTLTPAPVDHARARSVDLGDACGADDTIPMLLLILDECRKFLGRAEERILPQLQQRDARFLGAHDLVHRGIQAFHDGR